MTLRAPGLNEKRCIVRHGLGFYTALAAAGVYRLRKSASLVGSEGDERRFTEILSAPLAECVEQHPILSTLIDGIETESPSFRKASEIDLINHIKILRPSDIDQRLRKQDGVVDNDQDGDSLISRALEIIHNQHFEDASVISPWKVYVFSIPKKYQPSDLGGMLDQTGEQVLIAFAYSHAIGDGASGLAFHRTLSNALKKQNDKNNISTQPVPSTKCKASRNQLPLAIDSPTQLPVSWLYFLSAILNAFIPKSVLPKFLQQLPQDANAQIWTGAPVFYIDDDNDRSAATATTTVAVAKSAAHCFTISSDVLSDALSQCRVNTARLSSVLHQVIVNALHHELANQGINANTFLSSTSIDLRRAHGSTPDQMGVMASAVNQTHRPLPIPTTSTTNDEFWVTARQTTSLLAKSAITLQDQQVGLLKYVSSLRSWHVEKLGRERGTTYELSNVMSFDVPEENDLSLSTKTTTTKCGIVKKMIFSQPADVTGPAMSVNVVSVRGGDLTIVLSWQIGALGLGLGLPLDSGTDQVERMNTNVVSERERLERTFVTKVAEQIKHGMQMVAGNAHRLP